MDRRFLLQLAAGFVTMFVVMWFWLAPAPPAGPEATTAAASPAPAAEPAPAPVTSAPTSVEPPAPPPAYRPPPDPNVVHRLG